MTDKFLKNASLKKFNQLELRKLIQEQSSKVQKPKVAIEKIDSPLAKYDAAGNLQCIICKTQVKPNVWKVHVNSKQHKQKSEASKTLVEKSLSQNTTPAAKPLQSSSAARKATSEVKISTVTSSNGLNNDQINRTKPTSNTPSALASSTDFAPEKPLAKGDPNSLESILPEKFFDEPKKDSKALDEAFENEWSRFQKEIKEETSVSYQIEAGQQENAAIEREIEEIDDQLKRWEKVVEFENKTAQVLSKRANAKHKEDQESDDDNDDEDVPESLLDLSHWRSKRL